MKSIIEGNVVRYICDKRKLIVLVIFAFFCGSELGTATAANMSICEYLLFVMGNHYYIIYCMFMAYIFFSFESMREESSLIYIRMKKIKQQYVCRIVSIFVQTTIFVMAHIIIVLAIGITKFKFTNKFTAVSIEGYYNDTLNFLLEYGHYLKTPITACMMTVIFMIIGLTFISTIIYVIENTIGKKVTIVLMGIIILDIMIGFKMGICGIKEIFCLNNYFIFHHVMFMSGYIYIFINLLIEIYFVIVGYYLLKKIKGNSIIKRRDSYAHEMQKEIYKYSEIFILLYVVLNVISVLLIEGRITSLDLILTNLLGYSANKFDFMEFIRYILFFLIPIFFVGTIMEKERNLYNGQVAIRYGNRKVWKNLLEKSISRYLFEFIVFFGIVIIILVLLIRPTDNGKSQYISDFVQYMGVRQIDLYYMMALSIFLKVMEMFYYKNIFLLWNNITKSNIVAYIITFLGFILNFIIPNKIFISYGCSSIYYLTDSVVQNGMSITVIVIPFIIIVKIVAVKVINLIWRRKINE